MTFNPQRYFQNYFSDNDISNEGLESFAEALHNTLIARNENGINNQLIDFLTDSLATYRGDRVDLRVTSGVKLGKTKTNNDLLKEIGTAMRKERDNISAALGGRDTAAYQEIIPHDKNGLFTALTKTNAPVVLEALSIAATKYADQLGERLIDMLTGFSVRWTDTRGSQLKQKGKVKDEAQQLTTARDVLEIDLQSIVLKIADRYNTLRNPEMGMSYFSWHLLWSKGIRPGSKGKHSLEG